VNYPVPRAQGVGTPPKKFTAIHPLPPNHGIGMAAYDFMSGGIFNWFDTPYAFSSAVVKISRQIKRYLRKIRRHLF